MLRTCDCQAPLTQPGTDGWQAGIKPGHDPLSIWQRRPSASSHGREYIMRKGSVNPPPVGTDSNPSRRDARLIPYKVGNQSGPLPPLEDEDGTSPHHQT